MGKAGQLRMKLRRRLSRTLRYEKLELRQMLVGDTVNHFAVDDLYDVNAGEVLIVDAPGVLANDVFDGDIIDTVEVVDGFFVAVDGSAAGDGSFENPWGLQEVFSNPPAQIQPGDTIWVRGGIYHGIFHSYLSGTEEFPIEVRAYPNERVQIDLYDPSATVQPTFPEFFVFGDYGTYRDLEIYSSNPGPRETLQPGPFQTDVQRGGITVRGNFNRFINLVVHDLNAGFGHWGDGGEIYGTISYNNGWVAPDRQHGHGFYIQNENGTKSIADNVAFNQFGAGIHAFGSADAFLNNVEITGNISFNNGAAAGLSYSTERDILVGGGISVTNAKLNNNLTFQNRLDGTVDIGYIWGPENQNIEVTDNYFASKFHILQGWDEIQFERNTLVGSRNSVTLDPPDDGDLSEYEWDQNQYVSTDPVYLTLGVNNLSLQQWQTETGFDANSTTENAVPENQLFVRPNRYETGRANVAVYNWNELPTVEIDLSDVLSVGDSYKLNSVFDIYGTPILEGVYTGDPLIVPMQDRSAPAPMGSYTRETVGTDIRFAAFVVTTERQDTTRPYRVLGGSSQSDLGSPVSMSSNGGFQYDPTSNTQVQTLALGEVVEDQFNYTVTNSVESHTATVRINITGVNDAPHSEDFTVSTSELGPAIMSSVVADDVDSDDDAGTLVFQWLDEPTRGEFTDLGHGQFRFDPLSDFIQLSSTESAEETLRFRVTDSHGASHQSTLKIVIEGVNTLPIASEDHYAAKSDLVLQVAAPGVLSNDFDDDQSDHLTVVSTGSISTALGAIVSIMADGSFRYDATNATAIQSLPIGSVASDSFTYTLSDQSDVTSQATVEIEVERVVPSALELSGAGNYVLTRDSATNDFLVYRSGLLISRQSPSIGRSIFINGQSSSSDSLTLQFENGNPIPDQGVHFDGLDGSGVDEVKLIGGNLDSLSIDHDTGTIQWSDQDSTLSSISVAGIESVTTTSRAAVTSIVLTSQNDFTSVQNISTNEVRLTGQTFPTTTILKPTVALAISGSGGNDQFQIVGPIYRGNGAGLELDAEQVTLSTQVVLGGGSFHSKGTHFTSTSTGMIRTEGGDLSFENDGEVHIGANLVTSGGDFSSIGDGSLIFDSRSAVLYTDNRSLGGGNVVVDHRGSVSLQRIVTSGGSIDLHSDLQLELNGSIDLRYGPPTHVGTLRTSGPRFLSQQPAVIYAGIGEVVLDHSQSIEIGGQVVTTGGDVSVTGGGSLVTSSGAVIRTQGGDLIFDALSGVFLGNRVLTNGGDFRSTSSNGGFSTLSQNNNIETFGGKIEIHHGGPLELPSMLSRGGEIDIVSGDDVHLKGRVDTQGSGVSGRLFVQSQNLATANGPGAVYTGGSNVMFIQSGSIEIGELVNTGGGNFVAIANQFSTVDAGARIETRGGSVTLDIQGRVSLLSLLNTSAGALHLTLYVAPNLQLPLFETNQVLNFMPGSSIRFDAGHQALASPTASSVKFSQIIKARQIDRIDFDFELVNIALSDERFVSSLSKVGRDSLELHLTEV